MSVKTDDDPWKKEGITMYYQKFTCLLERYATGDMIAEAMKMIVKFQQPESKSACKYSNVFEDKLYSVHLSIDRQL